MAPYRRNLKVDFNKAQKQHPNWPVIVSEGDSWFSYADVIGRLDDPLDQAPQGQRPWALLRLEKAGAEILTILSGSQRAMLRGIFSQYPVDALLFSGGGNDVLGPDLLPLLEDYADGKTAPELVNQGRFTRRLRQIEDCYRELLDLLADAKRPTKVFVNSYDYLIPSDKGVNIFGATISGPWLLPHLEARNIPAALHGPIVRILIDSFVAMIDQLAAQSGGRLIRVKTLDIVGNDWKDEIHPNRNAAKRVAKAFEIALRAEGVIP